MCVRVRAHARVFSARIQEMIREVFTECTIFAIAHRIATIIVSLLQIVACKGCFVYNVSVWTRCRRRC